MYSIKMLQLWKGLIYKDLKEQENNSKQCHHCIATKLYDIHLIQMEVGKAGHLYL